MKSCVMKFMVAMIAMSMVNCRTTSKEDLNKTDMNRQAHLPKIPSYASPPLKFFRLLPGIIRGEGDYEIQNSKFTSAKKDFATMVSQENSNSQKVGFEVGVGIGPFTASASTEFEMSQTSYKESKTSGSWEETTESSITKNLNIPYGNFQVASVKMEMVVFENKQGKRSRVVMPTDTILEVMYDKAKLTNGHGIFDTSFDTLKHQVHCNFNTYTLDQMQEAMEKVPNERMITKLQVNGRVRRNVYYKIQNMAWPTNSIGQWGGPNYKWGKETTGCYGKYDHKGDKYAEKGNKQWRFQEFSPGKFEIINKRWDSRLFGICFPGSIICKWGVVLNHQRGEEQLWRIDFVEGRANVATITNVATGAKFGQWDNKRGNDKEHGSCGQVVNRQVGSMNTQWKLIPMANMKK